MAIRVLIVDDHEMIRWGLRELLRGTDIEIVGEAGTGQEAIEKAEETNPDVILLDIRLPDFDGLEALAKMRERQIPARVVILSMFQNPTYVARAVALGACDYILKGSTRDEIIRAIQNAASREHPTLSGEMGMIAETMKIKTPIEDDAIFLTQREAQVLRHIALGLSNKEIARSLQISVETVKEHVQNILRKLGVSDRTQAAVWAVRKGLA